MKMWLSWASANGMFCISYLISMKKGFSIWNAFWRSSLKPRTRLSHSLWIHMTWWFSILLFRGPFETPFPPLLFILRCKVLLRRVDKGISVVHSTFKTLISSCGGLLCGASTVWSVGSLLEPEQKVDSCFVLVWCIADRNALLLSPCLSLWCPLVKRHRSPSASVAFYRVQMRIRGPLDTKTEENIVFVDVLPKRRQSAAKISGIWYYIQHGQSLYNRVRVSLFAAKRGLFVHIRLLILLPNLMAGPLIMASALWKIVRSALPTIVWVPSPIHCPVSPRAPEVHDSVMIHIDNMMIHKAKNRIPTVSVALSILFSW